MRRPYSILLQVGFAMPFPLPGPRCALAAPFRPYPEPASRPAGRYVFCGTVPEGLTPPAGRYPAPLLLGARTFLPAPHKRCAAIARPSGRWAR